jgi:hypothetical protein
MGQNISENHVNGLQIVDSGDDDDFWDIGVTTTNTLAFWYTSAGADSLVQKAHMALNGSLYLAGTVSENYSYSDARLKENVESMESILDKINALNPVRFKWNEFANDNQKGNNDFGFIAQEAEMVFPELIFKTDNTYTNLNEEEVYRFDYKKLPIYNTKAIQELSSKVESSDEKIAKLEREIKLLKAKLNRSKRNGN